MPADQVLIKKAFAAIGRSFYGGCIDNLCGAPMGKGHNNGGKPFDINTACYLKPVFAAYDNPAVRKIVIKAGVKTCKSFAAEIMAGHYICHGNGDVAIYFGSGDVADDQSTTRIVDYFKGIPAFRKKLDSISSRFDITNGAIKFPDKTLRILPANLANTQGLNLGCVVVCDAFITGAGGMIDQAIARTTQYPEDKKVILESQGGEDGFDFDRHYEDTDQGELHVLCPYCGKPQIFNWRGWHRVREDGSDAGFKRGDNAKLEDGEYNEHAILKETHYECFDCREKWFDTPNIRTALDVSSHYVSAKTTALTGNVGFNFPQWINRRLPWGDMMLSYLKALRHKQKFGGVEPLKLWWQKTAARTWAKDIDSPRAPVVVGSYDVKEKIPDEVCRVMAVDCQQSDTMTAASGKSSMGHFWYVARAIDKHGNMFQLDRGYVTSVSDLLAVQKRLEISNENVGIDGGFWRNDVIDMAAKNIAPYQRKVKKHGRWVSQTILHTYTVLVGSGKRKSWKHADGRHRAVSQMQPQSRRIQWGGSPLDIRVPLYEWSNLSIKDQLSELIAGGDGMVKYKSLSRSQISEATLLKEVGNLTYENQMACEYRTIKKSGEPYWEKLRPDNHYFDCEAMVLVLFGLGGFLGVAAAPEADANAG